MRRSTLVAAVALLVGGAAACEPIPPDTTPPSWNVVHRAHETPLGPHVLLEWDAATNGPTRYRIDVNGVTATIVQPTATSCVMVGLSAGSAYDFRITAYDAAGNWSGSLAADGHHHPGFRPASYTTPVGPSGGPTRRCVPATDTDGDRLPDALETGTGAYAHTAATGSKADVPDTDVDGISDGDEVLGTTQGLDLYAMGARPVQRDLLVELDYVTDYTTMLPCGQPDLRPRPAQWAAADAAFAALDIPGTHGGQGINLIVDHGQGGVFDGSSPVPDEDGYIGHPDLPVNHLRDDHMAPERVGYFHHGVMALAVMIPTADHYTTGGAGSFRGDGLGFGFTCGRSDYLWSALVMHELGHNLGLLHGGFENQGHKPSYNSIMNYRYGEGLDVDCDDHSDHGHLGYSDGSRPSIDENAVDESEGLCAGGPAVDLNYNGSTDPQPYAGDLNFDQRLRVLSDHDDLAHLSLAAFASNARSGHHEGDIGCDLGF